MNETYSPAVVEAERHCRSLCQFWTNDQMRYLCCMRGGAPRCDLLAALTAKARTIWPDITIESVDKPTR